MYVEYFSYCLFTKRFGGKEDLPGRLIEGNSTNVEFLNLVDGTNGQGAVVGQSQAVK